MSLRDTIAKMSGPQKVMLFGGGGIAVFFLGRAVYDRMTGQTSTSTSSTPDATTQMTAALGQQEQMMQQALYQQQQMLGQAIQAQDQALGQVASTLASAQAQAAQQIAAAQGQAAQQTAQAIAQQGQQFGRSLQGLLSQMQYPGNQAQVAIVNPNPTTNTPPNTITFAPGTVPAIVPANVQAILGNSDVNQTVTTVPSATVQRDEADMLALSNYVSQYQQAHGGQSPSLSDLNQYLSTLPR
ncbi:MAG: hypothetical protein K6T26_07505 [Alicyclobacillus sp.]|nr:hypothetical protein [Alicyclobacillus sp.]